MKSVVIVGAGDLAEMVRFHFEGTGRQVAAFCVHADRITDHTKDGLAIVPYEELSERLPATLHDLFVAVGYADGNVARQQLVAEALASGYTLPAVVATGGLADPAALAPNVAVGEGGIVQPFAQIGQGTIVRSGAIVSHHAIIGQACYIGTGTIMGGRCRLGDRVTLGLGVRLRDNITIADGIHVGMAAVVTKDLTEPGFYLGSPARRVN